MFEFSGNYYEKIRWEGDLSEQELEGVTFVECSFRMVRLNELITRSCTFDRCDFSFARLGASQHFRSAFLNCKWNGASLFGACLKDCKCTGCDFSGSDLSGTIITGGSYAFTNWNECDLRDMDFTGIKLEHADFRGCNLQKAIFKDCDLTSAMLQGANLKNADLRGAVTNGVDLGGLTFQKTKLDLQQAVQLAESLGAKVL